MAAKNWLCAARVPAGVITPGGGNSKEVQFVFPTRCKMAELHSSVAVRTMHSEDKHMTRTELEINQQDMWKMLVFEERTTLTLAVEMLLRCQLSPEQILTKTATALEGSHYDS
jgi:hypothetical protein